MKQHTGWFMAALAVAGSLALVNSMQAQGVSGAPLLNNLIPANLTAYDGWTAATITTEPTGLRIQGAGLGSFYYNNPTPTALDASATEAVFQFTINSDPTTWGWVGSRFVLNDSTGASWYDNPGYSGYGNGGNPSTVSWNGNVVTWTVPLSATQLAAVQTGTDVIYGFNLVLDPVGMTPPVYDITFNSLVLTSVPEPSSIALAGLGIAGLLAFRRRR